MLLGSNGKRRQTAVLLQAEVQAKANRGTHKPEMQAKENRGTHKPERK